MTDLTSLVSRIERNREEKRALTEHERDIFTEAKSAGYDCKALRRVLQRRAMGDAAVAELDGLVDAYEAALGGKAVAAEELARGASVRQAAKKAGISVGAAHVQKTKIREQQKSEAGASTRKDDEGVVQPLSNPASDTETPPSTDGSTPPPAGNDAPNPPSSAALSPSVETDPDAGWHHKDGHDSYVLALRVGNGVEPHPSTPDTARTKAVVARLQSEAASGDAEVATVARRTLEADALAKMSHAATEASGYSGDLTIPPFLRRVSA